MFIKTTATMKVARLKKRIRGIQGGTSASKTISILLFLIWKAQTDKTETLTSIVSESVPHLKRGAMKDFLTIMKVHGYYKDSEWNITDSTYTFPTGSKIEFFSTDNPDKLRGARRDRLFMNECNNLKFEAFEQLEVRTKEFVFLDWNPTNEFWFYTEVLGKRNDVDHIILTYKDNEGLDANIIATIEARKNRIGWWKVYGEGQLGEVEGKIYKDWKIIEKLPDNARLLRYGLDFGYNDPTCLVGIFWYDGGFILHEVVYQKEMGNEQIAESIMVAGKALVVADSAEPKSIADIKAKGINIIGAYKGPDSVRNGISMIQELNNISVTMQSSNIIREYNNYMWEVDRGGVILNVPEHSFSHSMDAIRYGLTYGINNKVVGVVSSGGVLPMFSEFGI